MSLTNEWKDRYKLFCAEIQRCMFKPMQEMSFEGFCTTEHLKYEDAKAQAKVRMPAGTVYGEKFGYAWFFTKICLPKECAGCKIVIKLELGGEGLVYVNGVPFGTNRCNRIKHEHHHYVDLVLTDRAVPLEEYEIAFEAYAGDGERVVFTGPIASEEEYQKRYPYKLPVVGVSHFGIWRENIYQLFLDMEMAMDIRNAINEKSMRVMEIDNAIKKCLNVLAAIEDGEEALHKAVNDARLCLAPVLACKNGSTAPKMYAFGHSHLDIAWLWTLEETKRKCARSFSSQLHLMDMYPQYKFLQSQPYLYEQTKKYYPQVYEKIKQKVREGQFIPEGGMYVESDCNIPNGESLIRQFLYGKKFFKQELGKDSEFLWLPDVFGYSAAMPQILKGCNIKYFSTQKLVWAYNNSEQFPYNYFNWHGIDGSAITTILESSYGSYTDAGTIIKRYESRLSQDNCDSILFAYGYGDGGAGPTRDHIENLLRLENLEGVPKCIFTSPIDYFKDLENSAYAPDDYTGELYFAAHRGVYTSQADIKKGNRKCEIALREADVWNALLQKNANDKIENWYKLLLLNQFHDILPGSGIAEIYQQSRQDYAEILSGTEKFFINELGNEGDCLTIFNSLSWQRTALIKLPQGWQGAGDENGSLKEQGGYVSVTINPFSSKQIFKSDSHGGAVKNCGSILENNLIKAQFNDYGEIISISDKETGRQWLCSNANKLRLYRDIPRHFDAWDIDSMYCETEIELCEKAELLQGISGELYSEISFTRKISNSVISQKITLQHNSRELVFNTEIQWNEAHKLLKAEFPLAVQAQEMCNEIQFGYIKRPTHKTRQIDKDRFEVCNQKWTALTAESHTAALLNDCKYGISANGSALSLTLLRASKSPDFNADIGTHRFKYSLLLSNTNLAQSRVVQHGYELNCQPLAIKGGCKVKQMLDVTENIIIDTVKQAEDGSGIILRAYQPMNASQKAEIKLGFDVKAAYKTDMLENICEEVNITNGCIKTEFTAFQVQTFKLILR